MRIQGSVARGFERVREVFEQNFARRRELGAACAVEVRGERVVDLWGGVRDARTAAPWEPDTMAIVFSTTKGVAASVLAVAHARGWLDYDERVATYWPEFAEGGKGAITVRQLLAHQAGLAAVDAPLDVRTLADLDHVARALAAQRPAWSPGEHHGYHAMTIGLYEGELVRRVDPARRSLGTILREEITSKLGADVHVGLPADVPAARLARIRGFHPLEMLARPGGLPIGFALAYPFRRTLTRRAFDNPRLTRPEELDTPAFRAIEMPASNGVGSARGLARIYGALAQGGAELGIGERTMRELVAPPRRPRAGDRDRVLWNRTAYSLGWSRPMPDHAFGGARAFGTPGAGGSFAFADPDRALSYAYVCNRMGMHVHSDPRELALRRAVIEALR